MRLTLDIARRYLVGKKTTNAINIITWITMIGIAIGTAALIIILSVFNGFEHLLSGLFSAFNPDLKVSPIEGKFFELPEEEIAQIKDIPGIAEVSKTVQEIAIFEYNNIQKAGVIKGVDGTFRQVSALDSTLRMGKYLLKEGSTYYGIIGRGMAVNLGISLYDKLTPIKVYMPIRQKKTLFQQMGKEYKSLSLYPAATFSAGDDTDVQYILADFNFVNGLLSKKNQLSFLEIKLDGTGKEKDIRQAILNVLGDNFKIENRYEQDSEYLKIMNIERWVAYLIAVLVLLVIAFNMVGALWMMVLEKKQDIAILQSMGYTKSHIRKLFISEGIMITAIGLVIGIIIALIFYILQVKYGIIGVPDGFMIDAYPIQLKGKDFILVSITVMIIGFIASLLPAYRAGQISSFIRQE